MHGGVHNMWLVVDKHEDDAPVVVGPFESKELADAWVAEEGADGSMYGDARYYSVVELMSVEEANEYRLNDEEREAWVPDDDPDTLSSIIKREEG